jgi:hypothetical protein
VPGRGRVPEHRPRVSSDPWEQNWGLSHPQALPLVTGLTADQLAALWRFSSHRSGHRAGDSASPAIQSSAPTAADRSRRQLRQLFPRRCGRVQADATTTDLLGAKRQGELKRSVVLGAKSLCSPKII